MVLHLGHPEVSKTATLLNEEMSRPTTAERAFYGVINDRLREANMDQHLAATPHFFGLLGWHGPSGKYDLLLDMKFRLDRKSCSSLVVHHLSIVVSDVVDVDWRNKSKPKVGVEDDRVLRFALVAIGEEPDSVQGLRIEVRGQGHFSVFNLTLPNTVGDYHIWDYYFLDIGPDGRAGLRLITTPGDRTLQPTQSDLFCPS